MTQTTRRWLTVWLGALVCVGCGPADETQPQPEPELTEREFLEQGKVAYAKAVCHSMYECPANHSIWLPTLARYDDEAACVESFIESSLSGFWLGPDMSATEQGRRAFDREGALACLELLERVLTVPCSEGLDRYMIFDLCRDAYLGLMAEGEPCLGSSECMDGLRCESSQQEDVCSGVCQAPRATTCDGVECAPGEYCRRDAEGDFACARAAALGESCDSDRRCRRDEVVASSCVRGEDLRAPGVCVADGSVGVGGRCQDDSTCELGLGCDRETWACSDAPHPVEGEECLGLINPCAPGLTCIAGEYGGALPGTCGAFRRQGEPCIEWYECAWGLDCVGVVPDDFTYTPGACEALREVGGGCVTDRECASGRCEDGVCVSRPECFVPGF